MKSTLILAGLALAVSSCRTSGEDSETKSLFDADGQKIDESEASSNQPAWRPLAPADGLTGIGLLGVDLSVVDPDVCSAFIIDNGVDTARAYVVTNAHCCKSSRRTAFLDRGYSPPLKCQEIPRDPPAA